MKRVGALGAAVDVEGFALAGAVVLVAEDDDAVDAMWAQVDDGIGVLILGPQASERLASRVAERPSLLTVVMPR